MAAKAFSGDTSRPVVAVDGLTALRKDIRRLTEDERSPLYAELKAAGAKAANPVAAATRSNLPHGSGRLAGDVRVSPGRTGATIRMGRKTIPYAGWVEFGGTRPDGSMRQFVPNGRYLFPAARGMAEQVFNDYSAGLSTVFAKSIIWSNPTADPDQVKE